jgi:hypothetical protein
VTSGSFLRGIQEPEVRAAEQHCQEPADRLAQLQSLWRITAAPATQFVAASSTPSLTSPESTELPKGSQQIRTRVDLPDMQQNAPSRTWHATGDGMKEDEEGAGAFRPQLPSEQTQTASSANKAVSDDSTRNRPHEQGTKKIVEMIAPERDSRRELIQMRDVRAVSPQVSPPGPIARAPQPKNAPIPPTINVTIGRIEVRAVQPTARQQAKPKPATVLSLEDYLRQRAKGAAR